MEKFEKRLRYWQRQVGIRRLIGRANGPRVLVASVPKSGTNLLLRTLAQFPPLRFGKIVVADPDEEAWQLQTISGIRPGEIYVTHLRWTPALDTIMNEKDIRGAFIIRDPRDVCLSSFHHIMKWADHWCHQYFHDCIDNDHARLMAVITGFEDLLPDGSPVVLNPVPKQFMDRAAYLSHPRFCVLRFEDLIGDKGGGSDALQRAAIQKLSDHVGVRLSARDLDIIMERVFSPASPTFRKGKIGSWRQEMSDQHKAAFRRIAGELLVELGYEQDLHWN